MPIEEDRNGITKFVEEIVNPVEFTKLDYKDNSITLTAGRQSKAALIGRNRGREKELGDILRNTFGVVRFKIM